MVIVKKEYLWYERKRFVSFSYTRQWEENAPSLVHICDINFVGNVDFNVHTCLTQSSILKENFPVVKILRTYK